jgi:hypothetical protein
MDESLETAKLLEQAKTELSHTVDTAAEAERFLRQMQEIFDALAKLTRWYGEENERLRQENLRLRCAQELQ